MWQVRVYGTDFGSPVTGPDRKEWFPIEGMARRAAAHYEAAGTVALVMSIAEVTVLNQMTAKAKAGR